MRTAILIFAFFLLCTFPGARADQGSEIHIKAAFLYKFCGYTRWPETSFDSDLSPINLGVMGDGSLVKEFQSILNGQRLGNRNVDIHQVKTLEDLKQVHVLYIDNDVSLTSAERSVLEQDRPILTVTESDTLLAFSVIRFSVQNDHVRFSVSKSRAEKIGLHLSSQLLSVAIKVD